MLAWVVIYQRHLRRSRNPKPLGAKGAILPFLSPRPFLSSAFQPANFQAFQLSVFRTFFQVPYPVSPVVATLTKTAGVYTNNSYSGAPRIHVTATPNFIPANAPSTHFPPAATLSLPPL